MVTVKRTALKFRYLRVVEYFMPTPSAVPYNET